MSEPRRIESEPDVPGNSVEERPEFEDDHPHNAGPSLPLLYTLIAVALAAAIGLALTIVFPFYHRR
jgi:hypothetical protein